jgi:hypothetical protein
MLTFGLPAQEGHLPGNDTEACESSNARLYCDATIINLAIVMHSIPLGLASFLAFAIIAIGTLYLTKPRAATLSFGLPLPEAGIHIAWWLRLKGVRDIAAGLTVLALTTWSLPRTVGIVLLAEAFIPLGDMLLILAAKGSAPRAYGMHGLTAVVMVVTAVFLMMGVH